MTTTTKQNAFAGAADILDAGIDALFSDAGAQFSLIPLDMIEVKIQIREIFEDEENTLAELAASIEARGVLQPILLRPTTNGYQLVAGERRYRASMLAGLSEIPAYIREMTEDEADDAQLAENIQRKNLTQIEEAKKIQRDLDRLGSVEAVLEKHQKGRPWLSKMLALLNLPEQAKRLVTESVSADVEVINIVKTIEKADPKKAKALVDDLKKTRGKENARDKAAAVKEEVKPSKKAKEAKGEKKKIEAASKDQGRENSGRIENFAPEKFSTVTDETTQKTEDENTAFVVIHALDKAYTNIADNGLSPSAVLNSMSAKEKDMIETWLQSYYDVGTKSKDTGRAVMQGFRSGQFYSDGERAFALVAFLYGADSAAKFNLLDILGSVKE
jgi:ParB family transcriptional regulator, chromosome partitioning protein